MYGYRARIGLIVPSSNTVCEPEMAKLCPEGVATYSTRIFFEPTIQGLRAIKDHVERASLELSTEGICQIIAFCGTVGSLIRGIDDEDIVSMIEKRTNTPAMTTATAVKASLDALKVRKIAVATPYTKEINQYEREGFERQGYHVTMIRSCYESISSQTLRNDMIGRLLPEVAYKIGLKVNSIENEAILISCNNFRTIEIIQRLEEETGKPVISTNPATMWYALRKLGLKDSIKGFGCLLEQF